MTNSDAFTVLRMFRGDVRHQQEDIRVWEAAARVGRMASRAEPLTHLFPGAA